LLETVSCDGFNLGKIAKCDIRKQKKKTSLGTVQVYSCQVKCIALNSIRNTAGHIAVKERGIVTPTVTYVQAPSPTLQLKTLPVPQLFPINPGLFLPFWYNHLLFNPTLALPLLAPGLFIRSKSPPMGLPREEPRLPLLPSSELVNTLSFNGEAEYGLPLPDARRAALPNGEPMLLFRFGLPRPERGEARAWTRMESAKLPAEPKEERGVALREYRGGVMYCASSWGVAGRLMGGRPRACLCWGVRGMSSQVSGRRKIGARVMAMLMRRSSWIACRM
jgi:hypothetical protein